MIRLNIISFNISRNITLKQNINFVYIYVPPCLGVRKPTGPPRTFSSNNFSLQENEVYLIVNKTLVKVFTTAQA